MNHPFTKNINDILSNYFGQNYEAVFEKSPLLQYINLKTKSASRGIKARGSFANLYAIYVIVEDYLEKGFDKKNTYKDYEGAEFSKLFHRQRELPFGAKLQNHALNNRMNSEFKKFFPNAEYIPILRDLETSRYWINEHLVKIPVEGKVFNIAKAIIEIIDEYARVKKYNFEKFMQTCVDLQQFEGQKPEDISAFIAKIIAPSMDARLFEIVSYAILKYFYHDQKIYWGFDANKLNEDNLELFKTGRTNANDGGIDFVMKPLGRFFQVTETIDFRKYFLDIDKIHRYPITFVIKSELPETELLDNIKSHAIKIYSVQSIVDKYMECVEEVINVQKLRQCCSAAVEQGYSRQILDEIVLQSRVEFNYGDNTLEDG